MTETVAGKTTADPGAGAMDWGSDAVAETLRALGVPYIALVPGASFRGLHDSIVNHLGNANPEMIVCLHEEHAVAIAEGYARVTETPMAVALHANVGLMHATMPIFNAWCDRTPVLILGATGPVDADKRRPWIDWAHTARDQGALVRHYVKWDDQPASARAAVEGVLRAYQIADTRPKGPTYVCLDVSMQEEKPDGDVLIPDPSKFRAPAGQSASETDIDSLVNAITGASKPLFLMGRMSRDAGDWATRVRLAEATGATVMTSIHRPPAFPTTHPLHRLPLSGERPSADEIDLVTSADLIVSFDWVDLAGFMRACFGDAQTQKPAPVTIAQCSLDANMHNGWSMDHQALPAADINVAADPDRVVAQLAERFAGNAPVDLAEAARDHWTQNLPPKGAEEDGVMSLEALADIVGGFAREHTASLARLPIGWPGTACRFEHPLDYLGKDGGGAVGTGPGHTIGTALALKDSERLVVGVIGDGDYLMGVNALWTASNMDLPLILIVANNGGYYNDVRHQERVAIARNRDVERKWIGQAIDNPKPDIIGLARAQGFDGIGPVTNTSDLQDALGRAADAAKSGGRFIIEVTVTGY